MAGEVGRGFAMVAEQVQANVTTCSYGGQTSSAHPAGTRPIRHCERSAAISSSALGANL